MPDNLWQNYNGWLALFLPKCTGAVTAPPAYPEASCASPHLSSLPCSGHSDGQQNLTQTDHVCLSYEVMLKSHLIIRQPPLTD